MIDFHTHVFPEKIAQRSVSVLAEKAGIKPYTDGTPSDLRRHAKESGVSLAVVLPVITREDQFDSIFRFACKINEENDTLFSFGAVYPGDQDLKDRLKLIKEYGLKGIKIHPDYHGIDLSDDRTMELIYEAAALDLVISVHAGVDIGIPDPVRSTPQMALRIINEIGPEKMILAHTGGWKLWDDVERLLVGKAVYFDISFTDGYIDPGQWKRIIVNHGTDKILFGSDSPWSSEDKTAEAIYKLGLSAKDNLNIFENTAKNILNINQGNI